MEGKVKLIRKHAAGMQKIMDQKAEKYKDESGKDAEKMVEVIHRLAPGAFGLPFKVNDLDYVLAKYPAILEKV